MSQCSKIRPSSLIIPLGQNEFIIRPAGLNVENTVIKLINKLLTHRIIRYEDFSLDIWNQSLELLQFTGKEMISEVKKFLFHHTSKTEFEGKIIT